MGLLDGFLSKVGSNADVKNLAAKVGLSEDQVEQAIHALGKFHTAPGDTVQGAAGETGIAPGILAQIKDHIGGEGSLAEYASMLDKDGDGNPLNDLAGMAKKFFS